MRRNIDIEHLRHVRELGGVNQQDLPRAVHLAVKNLVNILGRREVRTEDSNNKYQSRNLLQRERIDVADDVVSCGEQ